MSDQKTDLLIVEDESDLRELYQAAINMDGYRARTADRASVALQELKNLSTGLAIVDHGLPDLDGLTLVEEMMSLERPSPIVILITGGVDLDRVRAYKAQVSLILLKPFSLKEFRKVVSLGQEGSSYQQKRKWLRIPLDEWASLGETVVRLKNISCGGCMIEVPIGYVFRATDTLSLYLADKAFTTIGVTCAWLSSQRIGIRFEVNSADEGSRILDYVSYMAVST